MLRILQLLTIPALVAAGTTCATNQTDWYSQEVGETPCTTYQRLRQICDTSYQVGDFADTTPGDTCDTSQVQDCCCNSVSWALSMLCFNCQKAPDASSAPNGIDAGVGGYQQYLGSCSASAVDQTLPANVQDAVCSQQIDIPAALYSSFWLDGEWFYTFSRESIQADFSSNPAPNFSRCPNVTSTSAQTSSGSPTSSHTASSSTSTSSSSSFSSSTSLASTTVAHQDSKINVGAIVGGSVAGTIVSLAIVAVGIFFLCRRIKRRRRRVSLLPTQADEVETPIMSPYMISSTAVMAGPTKLITQESEMPPPYSGPRSETTLTSSSPASPDIAPASPRVPEKRRRR